MLLKNSYHLKRNKSIIFSSTSSVYKTPCSTSFVAWIHTRIPVDSDLTVLTVFGLRFTFDGIHFDMSNNKDITPLDIIKLSSDVLSSYDSIKSKGYVPTNYEKSIFCTTVLEHLTSIGYKITAIGNNQNTYQLWYNFLLMNVLHLVINALEELRPTSFDEESILLVNDLEVLRLDLTGRLDPSIRMQIQKRGVTVIQNTYTGFDTEYELIDQKDCINKLLSVQMAVQTRTLIKIPLYSSFNLSFVHPLTSEITNYHKPTVDEWVNDVNTPHEKNEKINEMDLINESLKRVVTKMREKFSSLDLFNNAFITGLKEFKGVNYFEDKRKDQIVFALPLTPLKTNITYPDSGVTLFDLIQKSQELSDDSLKKSFELLVDNLTNQTNQGCDINKLLR